MPIWIEHAAVWRDLYSSSLLSVNAEPMLEQFYYVQVSLSMVPSQRILFFLSLHYAFFSLFTMFPAFNVFHPDLQIHVHDHARPRRF